MILIVLSCLSARCWLSISDLCQCALIISKAQLVEAFSECCDYLQETQSSMITVLVVLLSDLTSALLIDKAAVEGKLSKFNVY